MMTICAALALGMSVTAAAAPQNSPNPQHATPQRFATMAQVRARFGNPESKDPAVGNPPITTWHYPNFIVYFEVDQVIDTVVPNSPPKLYHTSELIHTSKSRSKNPNR